MAILYNYNELPVSINVKIGSETSKLTHLHPTPLLENGTAFVIREMLSLSIGLTSDNGADDAGCYLEIEVQQDNEVFATTGKRIIKPGQSVELYSNKGVFPFRLGFTNFSLFHQGQVYKWQVEVIPIHYNRAQAKAIHDFLEQQVKGICYDLAERSYLVDTVTMDNPKWYHDYARYHLERASEIISLLAKVTNDELKHLTKKHILQPFIRRTDFKGIRKSLTKGIGFLPENLHLNKKAVMEIDDKQAMWLKYTLYVWQNRIDKAIDALNREIKAISDKNKELDTLQNHINENRAFIQQNWNVAKTYHEVIYSKDKAIEQKKNQLAHNKKILTEWLTALTTIKHHIMFLNKETLLSTVELRPPKGQFLIKSRVLKRLKRLHDESETLTYYQGHNARITPVCKPTWQVFEYFVVVKTIECIADAGFVITHGLDVELANNIIEQGIPEGAVLMLENDSHIIRIVYDDLLPSSESDAEREKHDFYTFSKYNRPDLRIELYTKDSAPGEIGCFLGTVIVDAKHRKFCDLYSLAPTDTMVQLDGYQQIKYLYKDSRCKRRKSIVDRVLCVYSGNHNGNIHIEKAGIDYIHLAPEVSDTGEIKNLLGQTEYQEQFNLWLQEHI